MNRAGLFALGLAALIIGAAPVAARPLRVMTLDQCADQYALKLAPDAILALTPRADDPDSFMRPQARGRSMARPTLERAVAFQPDVVIRYWGGDPRLLAFLQRQGIRVVTIDDAVDFAGVRADIAKAAAGLDRPERGRAVIAQMDSALAGAGRGGAPASAAYLTAGGFTAGSGTLVDAILRAAGLRNAEPRPGYRPLGVERVALQPPLRFVLGFFDQVRADWRGGGRHPVVGRAMQGHVAGDLPASVLTCPAWFSAEAVRGIARS